jgi:hypothetical protein
MNNTIQEFSCLSTPDPLTQDSQVHCLFYSPAVPIELIKSQQTLDELLKLANRRLAQVAKEEFTLDSKYADWIANIVKINLMAQGLERHGIVKPMLLHYNGTYPLIPGTGDSRLKALSCKPGFTTVPGLISTSNRYCSRFMNLQLIESMVQLAQVCEVDPADTKFLFRFTNDATIHGIDWFEYSVDQVAVPSIEWCLITLQSYLDKQSADFKFTTAWFSEPHAWL